LSDDEIDHHLKKRDDDDEIISKIKLILRIYQEVTKKYSFISEGKRNPGDTQTALSRYLEMLRNMKDTFTSPEQTVADESLYFKRHIAFGIPSVIGTYHEPKFDALSQALRIEDRVRLLLEELIEQIDCSIRDGTFTDIGEWTCCFAFINDLFKLHGLGNMQTDEITVILQNNRLRYSQINDLLRIWQKELTWTIELFYRTFNNPLTRVLEHFPKEELPDHLRKLGDSDFLNKAADIIIRDMINSIVGFEELDRLLNCLIKALTGRIEAEFDDQFGSSDLPEVRARSYFLIDELSSEDAAMLAPILGAKAKNLVYLNHRGLAVPKGAVFSALLTSAYEEYISSSNFERELKETVAALETQTGSQFGGSHKPLFLSVRSGSYISMPGILSSILYCGLNETTLTAFIEQTGNPWLAWDSYRRFIEHYADIVLGVDPGALDTVRNTIMEKYGATALQELGHDKVEQIAYAYQDLLSEKGLSIPRSVYEQLKESIRSIFRSWHAEKALQFRKAMNVSEHWGTSVTIMQMIYGNDKKSGASVFFTRKPVSYLKGIYGETREMSTCDDIVYGKLSNRPLSKDMAADGQSLEEVDPELFKKHEELAAEIEAAMGGLPQEVESTYITGKKIYVLQTKRMEFLKGPTEKFHDICRMESGIIGRGLGVHGGALSGIAVLIKKIKEDFDQPVILMTKETSTDDVSLMPEIDGIITAVGGVSSHASILSQKFNISAVVGCAQMIIQADDKGAIHALFGNYEVYEGTPISIDGSGGLVYSGICMLKVKERTSKHSYR
jgi:pyruvate,orthophosphate dikinase